MRTLCTSLLLAALCALSLGGCSKPAPQPAVLDNPETCAALAAHYLACVKGAGAPDEAALKALEATTFAKCEELRPSAPKLTVCANTPCPKLEACLKGATPQPEAPEAGAAGP